jgi:hypothetical protein
VKSCSSTSVTDQHLVVVLKIKEKWFDSFNIS